MTTKIKPRNFLYFTPIITLGLVLFASGCDDDDDENEDTSSESPSDDDDMTEKTDDENEDTSSESPSDDDDMTEKTDDDTPTSDFENRGECRFAGQGEFKDNKYEGTIDYFLLADDGNGEELCHFQFDVKTVAESDKPCTDEDLCFWATVVELSNPTPVIDVMGYCANSERNFTESTIKGLVGKPTQFSFGDDITGHGNELRAFDEAKNYWVHVADGSWDKDTRKVEYYLTEGHCRY